MQRAAEVRRLFQAETPSVSLRLPPMGRRSLASVLELNRVAPVMDLRQVASVNRSREAAVRNYYRKLNSLSKQQHIGASSLPRLQARCESDDESQSSSFLKAAPSYEQDMKNV
jgi:transcriptional regulator with AAA-type ATPase domain